MYKTITFLFLLMISAVQLNAQTLEGRVIDHETQEPLEGATVMETGTSNGTATGRDGTFSLLIQNPSNGITVRFLGYNTKELSAWATDEPLEIQLESRAIMTGEVFVNALRVDDSTPIAYSNISRKNIEENNFGQDIPYLVSTTPSVVSTSDAGAGIGYTGIRVRGVDPARINVTLNGIPLNDAESHGVFWVNLPDLASSTQNIQIQRGVGTSTHGAGAFGATMNLQTALMNPAAYGEITTGVGSYGTQRYNVQLGSGILDNGWQFEGRLSKIESDGYIDRASSDLKSFYLSASHHGENGLLKADVFSGQEETYQAWNGVPEPILNNSADELERYVNVLFLSDEDAEHLRSNLGNRQFNEFTYENQIDRYQQDHYQLHYSHQILENWTANASLHYTYGRGFFEEFQNNEALSAYGIEPVEVGSETIEESDLIRRRWLDNHFYGGVFSTELEQRGRWSLTAGGGYNEYEGDHFGEVIWARFAGDSDIREQYYDNTGFKTDFNVYGKLNYYLTSQLNAYADFQYRTVSYRFLGKRINPQQEVYDVTQMDRIHFLNPKAGLVFRFADDQRVFASVSVGGKEPTRDEYVDSSPESRPSEERLYDYEFGYSGTFNRMELGVNLYYMKYKDQLILTGAVNDVGSYIRENVPDSYRAGVELQSSVYFSPEFQWSGNATFSRNKIESYVQFVDDYDQGGQVEQHFDDVDIAFSPNLTANSVFTYQFGGFSTEWISSYVAKQYLDNTQTDSRSIDPYWVNDIQFGYNVPNPPLVNAISLSLKVNNVLNEKYVSNGYTFGFISGGEQYFNYYYPQAGRNLLMNVKLRF